MREVTVLAVGADDSSSTRRGGSPINGIGGIFGGQVRAEALRMGVETKQAIRVLVVDDSAFMRRAVKTMLEKDGSIQVVGTANNGLQAIEAAQKLQPDVVTLDIEMPEMDGLTALRHIRRTCNASVLMLSSLTSEGTSATLCALRSGASDFIAKDVSQISLDIVRIEKELIAKVRALASSNGEHARWRGFGAAEPEPSVSQSPPLLNPKNYDVMMIGSSTGGPPVLELLFSQLPPELPLPIVVAQHMPLVFTKVMAERLNSLSRLEIVHAEDGQAISKGHVYICPGGQHIRVKKVGLARYRLEISPNPSDALYKPSVNELFASGAGSAGSRVLAIVLTGMGEDGLIGARKLHEQGATILAQDHQTCAVYGMPKAVTQAGLAMASLTPSNMIRSLSYLCSIPASV